MLTSFRLIITSMLLLGIWQPAPAAPIDEFRLTDIEQNIRTLTTTVREQARQIAELQHQPATSTTPSTTSSSTRSNDPHWLSLASWQRVKPGMNELQVIEILGPPTQQRLTDARSTRTLLYAMEIGRSGFLSGGITLSDGKVIAVEIPSLK